jgi:hypothetical protein
MDGWWMMTMIMTMPLCLSHRSSLIIIIHLSATGGCSGVSAAREISSWWESPSLQGPLSLSLSLSLFSLSLPLSISPALADANKSFSHPAPPPPKNIPPMLDGSSTTAQLGHHPGWTICREKL